MNSKAFFEHRVTTLNEITKYSSPTTRLPLSLQSMANCSFAMKRLWLSRRVFNPTMISIIFKLNLSPEGGQLYSWLPIQSVISSAGQKSKIHPSTYHLEAHSILVIACHGFPKVHHLENPQSALTWKENAEKWQRKLHLYTSKIINTLSVKYWRVYICS